MDFDYDALGGLSAVVRTGSFEAAAKDLGVTQSAVSQRIKQLEDKVGSVLIIRGRPCVATEDGLLLCRHMEQVQLLRQELDEQLHGETSSARAKVRIAVNNDSLATWFPEAIKRASDDLNLRLEIVPDDQDRTEDRLRSGEALAVVTSSETPVPGCELHPLGDMEYSAIASSDYAAEHLNGKITLESVSQSPSLRFDLKDNLPMQWLELAFGDTARLSSHFVPSYEGHLICCRQGVGWAMMPSEAVSAGIAAGELTELRPDVRVKVPLFWHTRSKSSGILQQLSEIVSDVAKGTLLHNGSTQPK
jgi:LysR family transcriptional regulator (chromosome initiation inhibitor)